MASAAPSGEEEGYLRHFEIEERAKRRRRGLSNYRLIRYADDWCLAVSRTRQQAEALRTKAAEVLSTMGLRLPPEKTLITHIDEGLDFLGWRIQPHRKRGTTKHYVYNYPAKKALRAVTAKIKTLCWQDKNLPLAVLLHRLNPMLRGWTPISGTDAPARPSIT